MVRTAWRRLRRVPSWVAFGLFLVLWWPVKDWNPPAWLRWLLMPLLAPYGAVTLALLVLSDRIDRLLVPEAYRTLGPDDEEVPWW